ncbi:hypothetical protein [Catellatospora citrea]|uniref:Uncharacterized protein n=1 Tax=Catellatospora citrea TaxID=53366 RepID=A0A8J3KAB1_9ACTN|nr:hypothetical protein [Catellatospora citrea]RKE12570.1 hypothetical protein C8E86_7512 [Catellatospora citrea]GIF96196.1 hypothetical protein Cci01nite_12900 [Catellatospora citrea]
MKHPPLDPSEWAELAELLPDPGQRELPPGRHEQHRARLLSAITEPERAAVPARRTPRWSLLRPALATAALVAVAGTVAAVIATGGGDDPVVAIPAPGASTPTAEPTGGGVTAKIRAYGTVRQLTDTADLVVRGDVLRVDGAGADRTAVFGVAEVLYRLPRLPATAVVTLRLPELSMMSRLEAGQHTVLYLSADDPQAAVPVYTPLSGDFGVFDVAGDTATARSSAFSVTGLREEDATARARRFTATLAELRTLARERG